MKSNMQDFRTKLIRKPSKFPHLFSPIQIGNYSLSIQASLNHYCFPKVNYTNPYEYESFELGLFDSRDEWVDLKEMFPDLDIDFDGQVSGWVPVETVQIICNRLEEI